MVPVGFSDGFHGGDAERPGIIDQNVYFSKGVFDGFDSATGVGGFGYVAFECQRGTAALVQQAQGLVELVFAAAQHGDLCTLTCKSQGNGLTDTGSPTRNDGIFSGQACHVLPSPNV